MHAQVKFSEPFNIIDGQKAQSAVIIDADTERVIYSKIIYGDNLELARYDFLVNALEEAYNERVSTCYISEKLRDLLTYIGGENR